MTYAKPMKDLYERLRDVGFDASFVRYRILPEWWEDELAEKPANRAMAEAAVSRMLGFPIDQLRSAERSLTLPALNNVRLKRNKGTKAHEVRPAILLAEQTAKAILTALPGLPPFSGVVSVQELRQRVLADRYSVDLEGLLEFAWSHGIAVLHLEELPKASKKFSGLALFHGRTPIIVLACRRDSPPWIAFHLAHELAHILLGHVAEGKPPLADSDIDQLDKDAEETAADEFACAALTGHPSIRTTPIYGLTADKLVAWAKRIAADKNIDPGTVALIYGRNAQRIAVAQNALKLLGLDHGAKAKIGAALKSRLCRDDLPESTERFLSLLSAV
ncbi:MAG: ImmA/IrrE family metallo-endopeptidase [Planctomycetota bacterium]|nr:ImmA/IrrE family metallo-endopeptidase [Planctomycetota bacterium]